MMSQPDIIVSWPVNCDYPLWRQFIHSNRRRFHKVIVVFTLAPGMYNYRDEVIKIMEGDNVTFMDSPAVEGGEDWRDIAVNAALLRSESPWLWFTEQDFFPTKELFEHCNFSADAGFRAMAVYQQDRLHPCCIFMARDLLDSIRRDFGIIPNVADHFCKIQKQLETKREPIARLAEDTYTHYNGLSHNWRLVTEGQSA